MTDILVVRHAESVWNSVGRWQGQADPPLSEAGRAEARAAGAALAGVSRIVASDLSRAAETARIMADALDIEPVELDAGLRERDVGRWQGLTTAEIHRDYPGALAGGDYPPGWESDESLIERFLASVDRIAPRPGPKDVVVVTHAGIIYAIERYFGYAFERIRNLHGRRVHTGSGGLRLGKRIALIHDDACLTSVATMERP